MLSFCVFVCLFVCFHAPTCVCAEIKAVPDLNLESDLKLDKLESFLGKLNSKGQSSRFIEVQESCLISN